MMVETVLGGPLLLSSADSGTMQADVVVRPFAPQECESILELDQGIYPTSKPVSADMIRDWFAVMPLLGARYETADGKMVGMSASVALKKESFDLLLNGHIEEGELTKEHLYAGEGPLFVHLYHVEVFDRAKAGPGFLKRCLVDTAANALAAFGRPVEGFAAYCVSQASIRTLEANLKVRRVPRHDAIEAFILKSLTTSGVEVFEIDTRKGETLDPKREVVSECVMFAIETPSA